MQGTALQRWTRPLPLGAALALAIAVLVVGVRWWMFARTHASTDDAYVHADIVQITPRIAGTVDALFVIDNQPVVAGDLLVRLDPADTALGLRRAEATLAGALQQVEEERAAVRAAQSQGDIADVELAQTRLDHARAVQLAARGVLSPDRLDKARTALRAAEARAAEAQRQMERARASLGIPLDAAAPEAAIVRQAQAARDEAALLLSYTELRAPAAGVVAKRLVQVGQRVQPGQPLMAVVPVQAAYVEANFKETELTTVRVGQPATVEADIYPGRIYPGHVESLSPGTGAAFALLPPENAVGNWVKVVQRLPVRIALDAPPPADHPLWVGLSVTVTIDTSRQDGPRLAPRRAARAGP
ncbi:MAG: HlyD family secretion protein [Candidatus Binatia bacterium]